MEFKGGARIGSTNVTWPFAHLSIDENSLKLSAPTSPTISFSKGEIFSLERVGGFLNFSGGIKINHQLAKYDSEIIFWTMVNPDEIINQIITSEYFNYSNNLNIENGSFVKRQEKIRVKLSTAFVLILIWVSLIGFDIYSFIQNGRKGFPLGIGTKISLGVLFGTALLLYLFKYFRKALLKNEIDQSTIRRTCIFLMMISWFFFLVLKLYLSHMK